MNSARHDSRIDRLISQWESLREQGRQVSVAELCASCPELREEAARQVQALQSIDVLLNQVREQPACQPLAEGAEANRPVQPPGSLGRYRLQELVGEGGFGQVWRGYDPELDRPVAVKIPRPGRFGSAHRANRFLAEARKAARLSHPAIVPVYDVGRDGPWYYIVFEWIDGQPLSKRLAAGPLPPEEAAAIVAQVAEALHHAHLRDLVHRDVKPGNILLDREGKVYLSDFGIAAFEDELVAAEDSVTGTPQYMAPEQAAGESLRVTARTDIYSLGVVLYELLTGRPPYRAESPSDLRRQVLKAEPRPPRTINDRIPAALERICLKAMAKDPAQRYATAADMAAELRRCAQPPRRKLLLAVGILLAAVAAVGIWMAGQRMQTPKPVEPLSLHAKLLVAKPEMAHGWLDVNDSAALPVRNGDAVRIEVSLNRPAYVYLLWIDSAGQLRPVYPWRPGDWDQREAEAPVSELSLPEMANAGWPLEGPPGLETLLVLAAEKRIPHDMDLRSVLSGLTLPQPDQQLALAVFSGKDSPLQFVFPGHRGPNFQGIVVQQRNRLMDYHRQLYQRLPQHFAVQQAISFVKFQSPGNPSGEKP